MGLRLSGFILQATLNPLGPANAALRVLEAGDYEICLSPHVREEIEDVLNRPSIRAKYPKLSDGRAEAMLRRLDEKARLVTVIRTYLEFPRDPDDEPILNLAIQEQADYIIDQTGYLTMILFDVVGRPYATRDANNGLWQTNDDLYGRPIGLTDPLGYITTLSLDRTTTLYDQYGRVWQQQDQAGNSDTFYYNSLNRVWQTQNALGQYT